MALFKELTDIADGSKITVNMDVVRYMQRIGGHDEDLLRRRRRG
jgi:hypothetical protein